jgi:hypothetical protein
MALGSEWHYDMTILLRLPAPITTFGAGGRWMADKPLHNTTFEGIGLALHLGSSTIERGNASSFLEKGAPIIARPFVLDRPYKRQDLGLMATQ